MIKKPSKNNRKLLFLEPITKDMSVDTIFNNLVRIFQAKGIRINHSNTSEKGVKE